MLRKKREVSQGAVEFALVLPILLLIMMGMIEMGHLVFVYATVLNAAREASRYGSASGTTGGIPQYENCAGIAKAATDLKFLANFNASNIGIYYDQGPGSAQIGPCLSMTPTQWQSIGTGSRVIVTVNSPYSLIVPIVPIPNFSMVSTSRHTILGSVAIAGTVVAPPPAGSHIPVLTSIVPSAGPLIGGQTVLINGQYLDLTGGSVTFDDITANCTVNGGATQLTCLTPVHPTPGAIDVTIVTVGGIVTSYGGYTYTPLPVITSINPDTGPFAGNKVVVLSGTSLSTMSAVTFGGSAATGCIANSDSQVTCTIPAHASGAVDVSITTLGGTSTFSGLFTYLPLPIISNINPSSGSSAGGTAVVITGSYLSNGTVTFGGTTAVCSVISDGEIDCSTPSHASGLVDVAVTTPGGLTTNTNGYNYLALPNITSVVPSAGPLTGFTGVVINGANFTGASVKFDSTPLACTVNSSTRITCNAPAHSAGPVNITVTTGVGSGSLANGFTYVDVPTITSIAPAAGPLNTVKSVVITGTNFYNATQATFGGTPATCVVNSITQITCPAPSKSTAGAVDVVVTASGGTGTLTAGYTYLAAPTIASLSVVSGLTGGGTSLVVTGTNFTALDSGTQVKFDTSFATCTFSSVTQVSCTTPSHILGAVNVSVITPGGTATLTNGFTYVPPAPTISSVNPIYGPIAGGTVVNIFGSSLSAITAPGSTVKIDTTNYACTVISDAQIRCTTLAHAAGTVGITVTTPGGTFTLPGAFTFLNTPTITSLSPTSGSTFGGTVVIITGTNLTAGSAMFGSTAGTSCSADAGATHLTCTTQASALGTVTVTVTTPGGVTSRSNAYTFIPPVPTLSSISPIFGPTTTSTNIQIFGTDLIGTSAANGGSVKIGGITVTCSFYSDTQLTCPTPAPHAIGAVDIVVTTIGGSTTLSGAFTYYLPPTITSISPTSGPTAGGTTVTINGSGLSNVSLTLGRVRFGGVTTGSACTVISDLQITCVSPAHTVGVFNVDIRTMGGNFSLTNAYTYVPPVPTITSISPIYGPIAGGTSVTIIGTSLTGATISGGYVWFGTSAFPGVCSLVSDTQITCTSPAHAIGAVNIVLNNTGGTVTQTNGFTYYGLPTITSITPNSGPLTGGTSVTIVGTNLTGGTVSFGGAAGTSCSVTATQIICTTPAHAIGLVDVVVTAFGGTVTSSNGYKYTPPAPTITSFSPAYGPVAGGTSVTINGTNLTGATIPGGYVWFGDVTHSAACVLISDNQITCTSPAHLAAPVNLILNNTASSVTSSGTFTYLGIPTISNINPAGGSINGGQVVTITGTSLTQGTATFGSLAGLSCTATATTIICTTQAHALGLVDVVVTTPGGSATATNGYTYIPPAPILTSLAPTSGPKAGGTTVVLTGTNLTGGSVTFGGQAGVNCTVDSSTQITCQTPTHNGGLVDVTVTTLGGSSTLTKSYTFISTAPTITSINPSAGSKAGGTVVVITGTDFASMTNVSFGGTNGVGCVANSDTQITCTTPSHAAGTVGVTVTNLFGTAFNGVFTYVNYAPSCAQLTLTAPSPAPTLNPPPSSPPAGYLLYTKTIYNIGAEPVQVQKATMVANYKKQDTFLSQLYPGPLFSSSDTINTSGSTDTITSIFDASASSLVIMPGGGLTFYLYYLPTSNSSITTFTVDFFGGDICPK